MDKILTVQEPFASALVHGIKHFEFRPWRITPGVKVWIHAGLKAGVFPTNMAAQEFLVSHGLDAKKRMFPADLFMEAVGG